MCTNHHYVALEMRVRKELENNERKKINVENKLKVTKKELVDDVNKMEYKIKALEKSLKTNLKLVVSWIVFSDYTYFLTYQNMA